jgi:hypothetical protein
MVSRDENGKAKYKAVYGHSEDEVREKLEAAKREVPEEVINPVKSRTFWEVAEMWLEENRGNMATTTYDRYRETLERDVFPTYENTPIKDITLEEMNRFLMNASEMEKSREGHLNPEPYRSSMQS